MKLNCVSCGHSLDLGDAYDDYEGQVRCFICGSLLAIRTAEGHVKSVAMAPERPEAVVSSPAKTE
ncbi:MAG: hypothetical protein ABR915_16035 [Thermoguttaceae bacterium]|jgi:DNA-directed RNA polymerase subunit N (RpoN/RPB10)